MRGTLPSLHKAHDTMTIRIRILLLGLLAIVCLLCIVGIVFMAEKRDLAEQRELLRQMERAEKLSGLANELQKERGISAGYLVTQSKPSADLLARQRIITNQTRARLNGQSPQNLASLAKLAATRESISRHQLSPADSFGYYTLTVTEILDQIDALAADSNSSRLKRDLRAHAHLLHAKEYLGGMRASLNESFSRQSIDRARVALVARQLGLYQYHSKSFLRDAAPEMADAFRAALAQPEGKSTFEIIEAAISERGVMIAAEDWFATVSAAIDRLSEVESQSLTQLRQRIQGEIAAAQQRLLIDAILILGVSLLFIFLTVSTVLRLLRSVNGLVSSIEHTIKTQDFTHRIELHGNDEIGVISRNFNELLTIVERLIKEKEYLASTDALTGAYNRHKFRELFADELQRKLRYNSGLALIMFDIDYFKRINDEYGHATGDTVLREVAHLSRDLIRKNDILVRWGGEEFMILMPLGEEDAAAALAEKLRAAISIHSFLDMTRVTASFGVSEYVAGDSLETLCARADEALYCAKDQGRNCVCVGFAKP